MQVFPFEPIVEIEKHLFHEGGQVLSIDRIRAIGLDLVAQSLCHHFRKLVEVFVLLQNKVIGFEDTVILCFDSLRLKTLLELFRS